MKPDFYQLIKEHNNHNMFLNETGIVNAMEKCYNQGVDDVLTWLSKMDYLSDNMNYIIDEWKNQNQNGSK